MPRTKATDTIKEAIQKRRWKRARERPRGRLFHYTTTQGFYGIIESATLRATHVRFMVDAAEIRYGREALREAFEMEHRLEDPTRDELSETLGFFSQTGADILTPVYAISFSEHGDDVSQWDRYSAGGRGYALGFDYDDLQFHFQRPGEGWITAASVHAVEYSRHNQLRELRDIVRTAADLLGRHGSPSGRKEQRERHDRIADIAHEMAWPVLTALSRFKHPSFRSEKEWRLIYTTGPHVIHSQIQGEFFPSERGLVPYVPLRYFDGELLGEMKEQDQLPLRHLVTGPRLPRSEAPLAAISYLKTRKPKYNAQPAAWANLPLPPILDQGSQVNVEPSALDLR